MRKLLVGVVAVMGAVGAGLIAVVAMQPAELRVERSKVIAAAPADVWPHVSDLRRFILWSPWQALDPDVKSEFSTPSSGVGAWYSWTGNSEVGTGKMVIVSEEPPYKLVEDLIFIEPFTSKAVVTMTLEPVDGGTLVRWGFVSQNDLMGKAFGLLVDMDAMLGKDFQRGLDRLAPLAEYSARSGRGSEAARAAEDDDAP